MFPVTPSGVAVLPKKMKDNRDLTNLTQRELLLLTAQRVEDIGVKIDKIESQSDNNDSRITVLETRGKFFGALWGVMAGFFSSFITSKL